MNNDIAFLTHLINETEKGKINWNKVQYNEYLHLQDSYDLLITHNEDINSLSTAAKFATVNSTIAVTAAAFNMDITVYKTFLKNVEIYLIEKTKYNTSYPSYDYRLNLVYFNVEDKYNCFNYFIDANCESAYSKIIQLAEKVYTHPNENENAQNFMNSILDEANN